MGGITRVKKQGTIARIGDYKGQMGRSFLGTHQQLDLSFRIDCDAEATQGPGRRRLAKRQGGAVQAVRGTGRVMQALGDGLNRRRRWRQIGGAQGKIEQCRATV